jgi:hypothetical protein
MFEILLSRFLSREHDWFTVDLPDYLFPPPRVNDTKFVDETVITEVCVVFDVQDSDVRAALESDNAHDQLKIAYHLILDNRRMISFEHRMSLKQDMVTPSSPITAPSSPFPFRDSVCCLFIYSYCMCLEGGVFPAFSNELLLLYILNSRSHPFQGVRLQAGSLSLQVGHK